MPSKYGKCSLFSHFCFGFNLFKFCKFSIWNCRAFACMKHGVIVWSTLWLWRGRTKTFFTPHIAYDIYGYVFGIGEYRKMVAGNKCMCTNANWPSGLNETKSKIYSRTRKILQFILFKIIRTGLINNLSIQCDTIDWRENHFLFAEFHWHRWRSRACVESEMLQQFDQRNTCFHHTESHANTISWAIAER